MKIDDFKIAITIDFNKNMIEYPSYSRSTLGAGEEYQNYLMYTNPHISQKVKLIIKETQANKITTEFILKDSFALPYLENAKIVFGYFKHLRSRYSCVLGRSGMPLKLDKETYRNLSRILDPVANNDGSSITISAIHNDVSIGDFTVNYFEGNAIQNIAKRNIKRLEELERFLTLKGHHDA